MFERVIAIDWSGRKDAAGQRRAIQRCVVELKPVPRVIRLEGGLTRDETVRWLIDEHATGALIGFDFAFSFPYPYDACLDARGWKDVLRWAAANGETVMRACEAPFWGRPGKRKTDAGAALRRSDLTTGAELKQRPKPIFQIGGAGAVGTGSLRGMPCLLALIEEGFSVWPFDGPFAVGRSTVTEIYPRWFTGAVTKSRREARAGYLDGWLPREGLEVPSEISGRAVASEDAFDALVAAVGMAEFVVSDGQQMYDATFYADERVRAEGWILGPAPFS